MGWLLGKLLTWLLTAGVKVWLLASACAAIQVKAAEMQTSAALRILLAPDFLLQTEEVALDRHAF